MSHPNKFFILLKFFHVKKPLHTIQKTVGESSLFLFINLISKTSLSIISCHFLSFLDLSCHFILFLVIWWERTQGFPRDFGNRGGTRGDKNHRRLHENERIGLFEGSQHGGIRGGTTLFQNFGVGDTADRGGSPHPPVGKTLWPDLTWWNFNYQNYHMGHTVAGPKLDQIQFWVLLKMIK